MSTVLAICEGMKGGERVVWVVVPVAGLLAWAFLIRALWRAAEARDRPWLGAVFVISGIAVPVFWLLPSGFSDPDYDFLGMFVLFAVAAVAVSAILGAVRGRDPGMSALASLLGAVLVPGLLVGLLFFSLAASGGCIG